MPRPIKYARGYRLDFKYRRRRYRKRFPLTQYGSIQRARRFAEQFVLDVLSGNNDHLLSPTAKNSQLDEVISEYHRWSEKVRRKAAKTLRNQTHCLRVFVNFCAAHEATRLSHVDRNLCLAFQEYFFEHAPFNKRPRADDYNPVASWQKYHQFLSALFNWCVGRGYVAENPAVGREFQHKLQQKLPDIFTYEELAALFNFLDQEARVRGIREADFFRLLLYTGMRPGEAIRLQWRDVDLKARVIRVTGQTKTKKVRAIPIHTRLRRILSEIPTKKCQYVFDNGKGEPIGDDKYWYRVLRRGLTIMKIRHHRVYDFRHTFAANLVRNGVHIGVVRELLGHARLEQTVVYIHFAPQHLKQAVETLQF